MNDDAARRRYRQLLRLAPLRLRDRHAAGMEDAFVDAWRSARASGRWAAARVWLRATLDLLAAGRYRRPASLPLSLPAVRRERPTLMLGTELRSALRSFRRQKFATSLVVVMLGLGIAATIVVFSLVNEHFLRPFPFPEQERLIYVNEKAPRWNLETTGVDFVDFNQWRKASTKLEGIGLIENRSLNLSDDDSAERIVGAAVTFDYFAALRVSPILGRLFTAEEDRPKAADVMLISERIWAQKFARDPHVLGKTMRLNGRPFEIVGVMPKEAEFPDEAAVWIALRGDPNQRGNSYSYDAIARMKPGVTAAEAEQDLLQAHAPIWETRDKEKVVSPYVLPLREPFVRDFRTIARALGIAVGLLLVVACANVAAVMLARAIARRREIGIRLAIGAGRWRLLRQLFIENLLLAVIGGALGFLLGRWALHLLVISIATLLPSWTRFALDWRIVGFSAALSIGTSLLFGLAPALHAVRGDLRTTMSDSVAGSTVSPRGRRTLGWLIAAEFMLAAVLLVGGVLLVRAFNAVRHTDPGYRPDHVFVFSASLPGVKYPDGPARMAFWDRLLERIRATSGVETAGLISCPPLTCHLGNFFRIEGRPPNPPGQSDPVTLTRVASDGYFEAMGIRLKFGRFFDATDGREGGERVVIVNETFVRTFWPGETNAVGKRIRFNDDKAPWITVLGVAGDVKHYGLERPMRPGLYFPPRQMPDILGTLAVAIRTTGDPEGFASAARSILHELDPMVPLYRAKTAEAMLKDSMRTRATYSWMLAVFAGLALILALGGTYGVTSYLVSQRTREIGIRLAMGARSADIAGAVLRSSLFWIVSGVALGLVASIFVAAQVGELLFGVSPRDPSVLAGTAVVLALAAMAANWIPARRAARTDPMVSLRE